MSSLYKVPYTKIIAISPHLNAERLEIATVFGFQVVVQKGRYSVGDEVFYIPVDSILPPLLEAKIFPPESKVKLQNHRVRQIRLRGFPSQGLLIDKKEVNLSKIIGATLEHDYAEYLGITKYEPPVPRGPSLPQYWDKPKENPRLHKYGGIDNIKWYPTLFKEGEEVVVQCKLHGSNCRASIQPTAANTLTRKILKFFRLLPKYEFVYGSNNVQLQQRPGNKGFYGVDVYGAVLNKINVKEKLKPGETVYGEVIGPGIQKGYEYGHKEHHFVLFDVKKTLEDNTQVFMNPEEAEQFAKERGFTFVPVIYTGPFNKEEVEKLVTGPSLYYNKEPVREGIVIKSRNEYSDINFGGKKVLKWINPEYLDNKENTDFN